jgi:outer membrane protein assembly factor BamE (lipoprotein component of BamABCDE complex)
MDWPRIHIYRPSIQKNKQVKMKINIKKYWILPASVLAMASLLISAYVINKSGAWPKRTVVTTASSKRHLDGNVVDEKYVDQNIRVGMSRAKIEDIIGVPESSHVFMGSVRYEYKVSQNPLSERTWVGGEDETGGGEVEGHRRPTRQWA